MSSKNNAIPTTKSSRTVVKNLKVPNRLKPTIVEKNLKNHILSVLAFTATITVDRLMSSAPAAGLGKIPQE
jgi:hypothetical protein